MTGTQPMQADGDGSAKDRDGVNTPAGEGESQGGAYPHPDHGKSGHFDGGQTHKEYEGPDNPNATTESDD